MAAAEPTLTRHDLEAKIVKRSWTDEAFRKEFIADPAGTFVKYMQVPAADLPKILIHEEPAGSWHIVLPLRPPNAGELSEHDLETVAGGAPVTVTIPNVRTAITMNVSIPPGSVVPTSIGGTPNSGW
jgi:hypothetical protein